MTMPRWMPKSLLVLLPGVVGLALLFVPLINIVTFWVLAFTPLLTVSLNGGFLALGLEATFGKASRFWLAAPVIWFGGYAVFAAMSNQEIARLDGEYRRINSEVKVAFDPTREDLVYTSDSGEGFTHTGAAELIRNFDISVVYAGGGSQYGGPRHFAYRLGGRTICQRIKSDPVARSFVVVNTPISQGDDRARWKTFDDLCIYAVAEEPAKPTVTIDVSGRQVDSTLAPRTEFDMSITDRSGEVHLLRSSSVGELGFIPRPSLTQNWGGGLFAVPKGPPLARSQPKEIGADGVEPNASANTSIVGRALNLKPASAISRRATINSHPDGRIDALVAARTSGAITQLEALLKSPTAFSYPTDLSDVRGLREQPQRLAPYAGQMVDAFVSALDQQDSGYAASVLVELIAVLPDEEFAIEGPRLLRFFAARAANIKEPMSLMLLMRFGDLGADAIPVLRRVAFADTSDPADYHRTAYAMLGLCRVGRPAAMLAKNVHARLVELDYNYGRDPIVLGELGSAAFVTLLRMGRADLTEVSGPQWEDRFVRLKVKKWRETITAASGPEVCKTY